MYVGHLSTDYLNQLIDSLFVAGETIIPVNCGILVSVHGLS